VSQIPLTEWNLKTQDPSIRHLGPMAQDFRAAFGLGEDERHINTVDSDGEFVSHYNYDSFGNQSGDAPIQFGFTGRDWDPETGLQYNRARYYDPTLGRWIGQDPIGFEAGDANLYRYVGNIPTAFTDPSGSKTYLVTDPWTGATRWVGQKELTDGSWYKNKFDGDTSTFQDLVSDSKSPL